MNKELKILITGASGFVGYHLCKALEDVGYKNLIKVSSREIDGFSKCDLLNQMQIEYLFLHTKPDVVIHLAAVVGGIGANQKRPGDFCYNNLKMGLNIVESCKQYYVQKLVFLSTVCSYPKFAPIPFKEDDIWNGYPEETNAPYGIAKKAIMTCINAYRDQFNMNGITLVPVNMYGPNESNLDTDNSHVVPALILKVLNAQQNSLPSILCWGTGAASREFLYVEDCVKGIIMAMEQYNKSEPVNIGTGQEITIKELILMICEIVGYRGNIIWEINKPDGQPRRCLDTSRARDEFGFQAQTPIYMGLTKTIEWFKNHVKYNN